MSSESKYAAMSADVLIARKRCCQSGCLHCPYGFTIKKFGLVFHEIGDENNARAIELANGVDFSAKEYKLVSLKDVIFALIKVDHLFVRELYIDPYFIKQGLSKEVIESYYFY